MTSAPNRWYLGSKNDGLSIINTPPRPSNDDVNHEATGPSLVLNVDELPQHKAQAIVEAHNASLQDSSWGFTWCCNKCGRAGWQETRDAANSEHNSQSDCSYFPVVHIAPPLLSFQELRALLDTPESLQVLIDHHDVQATMAEPMGYPTTYHDERLQHFKVLKEAAQKKIDEA